MASTNNSLNNQSVTGIANENKTFTVINNDTAGTSDAVVEISSGGSSAGDASTKTIVSIGSTFSTGIDNSDNDNFVISASATLGTTNTFVLNSSGINTLPLQPSYSAYPSITLTNVTGNSVNYTTNFNTEIFDRGANSTTTTFTAPQTGRYVITAVVTLFDVGAGNGQQNMQIVSSNRNYLGAIIRTPTVMDVTTALSNSMTRLVDMDASDTVSVSIVIVGGTQVVDVLGGTAPIQSIRSAFLAT